MKNLETNIKKLVKIIGSLNINEKIELYNNACEKYNWSDDIIYENDEYAINEMFSGKSPFEIFELLSNGEYDINGDWFYFDGYGNIKSFKDHQFNSEFKAMLYDIARESIENDADYGNKKVAEFLNDILSKI